MIAVKSTYILRAVPYVDTLICERKRSMEKFFTLLWYAFVFPERLR